MKPNKYLSFFLSALLTLFNLCITTAQSNKRDSLTRIILHHDSIFWQAYNVCDLDKMAWYLTDDLEFYHDKNGLTKTRAGFLESIRKGMCGNPDWHLRREEIVGTVRVFPMSNTGAMISGEHLFYIKEKDRNEFLDGYGKFMQLWVHNNGQWKMSRIFSYDHGPAPYTNKRKEIAVSISALKKYSGRYQSPNAGLLTVTAEGNTLKLSSESFKASVYPESENKFFTKERDLQFEFVSENGKVTKMVVHEKGKVVEEAARLK